MNDATPQTRILAVDDETTSRLMLESALESLGHNVTVVDSPTTALEHARTGEFTVIISDWDMPDMDGVELCQAVRMLELDHYVYFILLTGRSLQSEVVRGLASGADDFISKPFDPDELAMRVDIGIRTVSLDTRDATIFALARLAESRDPETGAHLERVRNYSRLIAIKLFERNAYPDVVTPEFIRLIFATSPLHDIGKVAIPDSILLKPGRLSDREFEVMKSHTRVGAETLEDVVRKYPWVPFLRIAHEIALSHHERWDGGGYPNGLAGDDIPLAARIVTVADVFDALVSKRVYKSAMSHEVALSIIREESGTQFDPECVEALFEMQDQIIEVYEHFRDDQHDSSANALAA